MVSEDLQATPREFGEHSLVARTWRWILHGGEPGPTGHMHWSQFDGEGPPSAAILAAESTADQPSLLPRTPWSEFNKARFICWWCTANPEDEVPLRFRSWDSAPISPAVTGEGLSQSPCVKSPTAN